MSAEPFAHSEPGADGPKGLRPVVAASCRSALRELLSATPVGEESVAAGTSLQPATLEHLKACAFCSARVQASASLSTWASARPELPAALASPSVLEGIYERVSELAEHGSLGSWLEQASNSLDQPFAQQSSDGQQPAGEACSPATEHSSLWREAFGEQAFHSERLGDLVRNPVKPDAQVWSGVCRSILAGVATERGLRRRLNWQLLLAGAAAIAVIGLIATAESPPVQPTIVFVDLDRAPDVDFSFVRYGSRH